MKCQIPHPDLLLYAEGLLPQERERALKSHLEGCSICLDFLLSLGDYTRFIEEEKKVPNDPYFYTRVIAAREAAQEPGVKMLKRFIPALVAATIFAGGIITGINVGKIFPSQQSNPAAAITMERGYLDELDQESIESFFLTTYEEDYE